MQIFSATQKGPLRSDGFIDPNDVTIIKVFYGAPFFQTSTVYREGDIVKPSTDNGYYYQCSTNGVSGGTEPVTWSQTSQISGTATFTAVPWDLWLLPTESLTDSDWDAPTEVTTSSPTHDLYAATIKVDAVTAGTSSFVLTNQVTKTNGEKLSRSFKFKTNEQ